MKFITLDVYNSWYDSEYEDDRPLKEAFKRYSRHLDRLHGVLPAHILTLARLEGMDDGLVVQAQHDRRRHILSLILRCGNLSLGYYDLMLRYEGADISPQDEQTPAHIACTTRSHFLYESDLYFHELDKTEDGRIEHRLLFHPGIWFAIRCRALSWRKVARPGWIRHRPIVQNVWGWA